MASKENLSFEAYHRQIAGLQEPWKSTDRPKSDKSQSLRMFADQQEKIERLAKSQGKTRADLIRDAIDLFLETLNDTTSSDRPQETTAA